MMITPLFSFPSRRILRAVAATLFGLAVSAAASAATLTVTSTSDDLAPAGACSLRGAVAAVNNAVNGNGCTAVGAYGTDDTIIFAASVSGTISFTSEITISKNLTINGPGASSLALDGGGTTRLLYVNGGTALTVTGLTLQKGYIIGGSAGAILIGPSNYVLTVRDSLFSRNRSTWAGAININQPNSTLVVENCTFSDNTSVNYGGAFQSRAATVSGSTFTNNTGPVGGGAIFTNTVTVSTSTFTGNKTVSGYDGGAIRAQNTATIDTSAFDGNEAGNLGGAIAAGTVTVSASTFTGNKGPTGGGAIFADIATTVSTSTFAGNTGDWGGAILAAGTATVSASTFIGNTAGEHGGAIWAQSSLTGNGLTLVNNTAPDGAVVYIAGGSGKLNNSLIAGDTTVATAHCFADYGGTLTGGTNLEWRSGNDTNSCNSAAPVSGGTGSLTAIVADTLTDNGGPTQTLALPSGSPALDAAAATSTAADQRGVIRGGAPDLGAYESLLTNGLPDGSFDQTYSGNVAAGSGTAPYTYAVTTGSLPPGLTLDSDTGAVSGKPATGGTYTFTITATEASGNFTRWNFTVTILGGPPPPPSGATAIPALGPWALLALVGLLGGAGVMRRRG